MRRKNLIRATAAARNYVRRNCRRRRRRWEIHSRRRRCRAKTPERTAAERWTRYTRWTTDYIHIMICGSTRQREQSNVMLNVIVIYLLVGGGGSRKNMIKTNGTDGQQSAGREDVDETNEPDERRGDAATFTNVHRCPGWRRRAIDLRACAVGSAACPCAYVRPGWHGGVLVRVRGPGWRCVRARLIVVTRDVRFR